MKFNSSTTVHYRRGQYSCKQIRRPVTSRAAACRAAPRRAITRRAAPRRVLPRRADTRRAAPRRAAPRRAVTRRAAPYDQSCAAYKRSLPPKEICLCLLAHSALQEVHQYRHFRKFNK